MERTAAENGESSNEKIKQNKETVQMNTQVAQEPLIPPGLVGDPSESAAWLDGVLCQSLIDSGSQVMCISQSFYQQCLSHRKLHTINDILEGAAGQRVPYLGYITVDVKFPKELCGTHATITALALVCPDQTYSAKIPLLAGTNILLPLIRECRREGGNKYLDRMQIHAKFIAAYMACE